MKQFALLVGLIAVFTLAGCNPSSSHAPRSAAATGSSSATTAQGTGGDTQTATLELSLFDLGVASAQRSLLSGDGARVNKDIRGNSVESAVPSSGPLKAVIKAADGTVLFSGDASGGKVSGKLSGPARTFSKPTTLELQDSAGAVTATIQLPPQRAVGGKRFASRVFQRSDKTLAVELNETDGDGRVITKEPRMTVDSGHDLLGTGAKATAVRMDFPNGLSIYDVDADGVFGAATDIWDSNGDGTIGPGEGSMTQDPDFSTSATAAKQIRAQYTVMPKVSDFTGGGIPGDLFAIDTITMASQPTLFREIDTPATLSLLIATQSGLPPFGQSVTLSVSSGKFVESGAPSHQVALIPPAVFFQPGQGAQLRVVYQAPASLEVSTVTLTAKIGELTQTLEVPVQPRILPEINRVATRSGQLRDVARAPVIIEGKNFGADIEDIVVSFGGARAVIGEMSDTKLKVTVPVGAKTGPIVLDVAGKVVATATDFTILPSVSEVVPADLTADVDPTAPLAISFTGKISSLAKSEVRLVAADTSTVALSISPSGESDRYTLTPVNSAGATTSLAENAAYNLIIEKYFVNQVFTTTNAPDTTPPSVVSITPPEAGQNVITIVCSEALAPTSVGSNAVKVTATGLTVSGVALSDPTDRTRILFTVTDSTSVADEISVAGLLSGATYTIAATSAIRDRANNPLSSAGASTTFTTPNSIDGISPSVGMPGTEVVLSGGVFPSSAASVTATYNTLSIPVAFSSSRRLILSLPESAPAGSGVFTVKFGDSTLTSPSFLVTDELAEIGRVLTDGTPYELALYRKENLAYAIVQDKGVLFELNAKTGAVTGRQIFLPGLPTDVRYDAANDRLLVPNFGREASQGSTLAIIKRSTFALEKNIPVGARPTRVAVDGVTQRAFISNYADATITAIDLKTGNFLGRITAGLGPNGIAITPDGKKGYVANYQDDTVTVFSPAALLALTDLDVGDGPVRVRLTPSGKRVFVTNFNAGTISIIDTATDVVMQTLNVGGGPLNVSFTPDGLSAVVSLREANALQFLTRNPETFEWSINTQRRVSVGRGPAGIAITSDGSTVVVTESEAKSYAGYSLQKPAPTIKTLSRETADPGSTVVITGAGFDFTAANNLVTLNNLALTVDAANSSPTKLTVSIPATKDATGKSFLAQSGSLIVTRQGRASNEEFLEITGITPRLTAFAPRPGTVQVPLNVTFKISFSEPLSSATIKPGAVTLRRLDSALNGIETIAVKLALSPDGRQITATPASLLAANSKYRLTVTTSLKDLDSNAFDGNPLVAGAQPFPDRVNLPSDGSPAPDYVISTLTVAPPQVLVTPPTIPQSVKIGDTLVVSGSGFTADTKVFVNGLPGQITVHSSTSASVVIPAGLQPGPLQLVFLIPGGLATVSGNLAVLAGAEDETAPLVIYDVSPNELKQEEGGLITVIGDGFDPTIVVTINGSPATVEGSVSPNGFSIRIPPQNAGVYFADLVITRGADLVEWPAAVAFIIPPSIIGISPTAGPAIGGDVVFIFGDGFRETDQFFFGANEAIVLEYISSNEVVVLAPPGVEGGTDVRLVNPTDNVEYTLATAYEYFPEATGGFGSLRGFFSPGIVTVPDEFGVPHFSPLLSNASGTRLSTASLSPFGLTEVLESFNFQSRVGRFD